MVAFHLRAAAAGSHRQNRSKVGIPAISVQNTGFGHVGENQLDSHSSILKSLAPTARPTCPAMLTVKRFKICLSDRRQCRPRGGYGRPISRPKLCFTQRRSSKNPTLGETYSKNLNNKENEAVPLPLSQSPVYTCGVDTPFIHAASSLLLVVTLSRLIPTRLMPHSRVPSATSISQPTLRAPCTYV